MLHLRLADEDLIRLRREAERQGVSPELLAQRLLREVLASVSGEAAGGSRERRSR